MMRNLSRRVWITAVAGLIVATLAATAVGIAQQRATGQMATLANTFLNGLTPELKGKLSFPIASEEWTKWAFIPPSMAPRNGVPLKDMPAASQQQVRDLLKLSLSQTGYDTATAIMANEAVLKLIENKAGADAVAAGKNAPQEFARDPLEYFVSVFGTPSATGQWGWRLEGHHVSLHFAVDGAKTRMSSTPIFFGANPAVVPAGFPEAGRRLLPLHEDIGRELVTSLTDAQKTTGIVGPQAAGDIATGTQIKVDPKMVGVRAGGAGRGGGRRGAAPADPAAPPPPPPPPPTPREVPEGIAYSALTAPQQAILMRLITTYTSAMQADVATERMTKIREAGLDKIYFGWWGPTTKGAQYYYRIQGPTFVAEHNNTQGGGNHVHQVWRDFIGDFGRDLLAEHMAAFNHPGAVLPRQ
jgi:hypothetical protein